MVLDPYFAMKCALGENPKKGYETTRMGIAATLREFLLTAKVYAETPVRDYDRKLEPWCLSCVAKNRLRFIAMSP